MANARGAGRAIQIDEAAIARAEAALKGLSSKFDGWLNDEFAQLQAALGEAKAQGMEGPAGLALYRRAHDLKGLGATCENPLVSQLGASLCRLLDEDAKRARAPMPLIQAHVAAIQAAIRDRISDASEGIGAQLLSELNVSVDAVLKGA